MEFISTNHKPDHGRSFYKYKIYRFKIQYKQNTLLSMSFRVPIDSSSQDNAIRGTNDDAVTSKL